MMHTLYTGWAVILTVAAVIAGLGLLRTPRQIPWASTAIGAAVLSRALVTGAYGFERGTHVVVSTALVLVGIGALALFVVAAARVIRTPVRSVSP